MIDTKEKALALARQLYETMWIQTYSAEAAASLIESAFLEWHEALSKRSPHWTEEEIDQARAAVKALEK